MSLLFSSFSDFPMQSHLREGVARLPYRRRGRDRAASAACALALLLLAASPALERAEG